MSRTLPADCNEISPSSTSKIARTQEGIDIRRIAIVKTYVANIDRARRTRSAFRRRKSKAKMLRTDVVSTSIYLSFSLFSANRHIFSKGQFILFHTSVNHSNIAAGTLHYLRIMGRKYESEIAVTIEFFHNI